MYLLLLASSSDALPSTAPSDVLSSDVLSSDELPPRSVRSLCMSSTVKIFAVERLTPV